MKTETTTTSDDITFEKETLVGEGVIEIVRVTMPIKRFIDFVQIKDFMIELGFIEKEKV